MLAPRNRRRDRPAEPIADDRRAACLRQPAAKAGKPADADGNGGVVLAAITPARQQQQEQRADEGRDDPARRHRIEPAEKIRADRHATSAPNTMTAVALRSACFHAFGTNGAAATKSIIRSSAATRRGAAMLLASGMKISAEPKPEIPAPFPRRRRSPQSRPQHAC